VTAEKHFLTLLTDIILDPPVQIYRDHWCELMLIQEQD